MGVVSDVRTYGALVNVEPPDGGDNAIGLVGKTELNKVVKDIEDAVKIGQQVLVRVKAADAGKLSLSMRQT